MSTQPLASQGSFRAIAPRTEAFAVEVECQKKRKRNSSGERQVPKGQVPDAKKQRRPQGPKAAWCPLCHRGFTQLAPRNNHIGIPLCFTTAIRRGLIPQSTSPEERTAKATAAKKDCSSNRLIHLKDSSERFEAAENHPFVVVPTPVGRRSPVEGSNAGIPPPIQALDATVASSNTVYASGGLDERPPQPVARIAVQRSASNPTLKDHQRYRAAFEREMTTGPLPLHRSPSMPQPPQNRPPLQTSASFGGFSGVSHGSTSTAGQSVFSAHQPHRSIEGGDGEFGTVSHWAHMQPPSSQMIAGSSRASSSRDLYTRSGTPSQQARPPPAQVEYAPNPYMAQGADDSRQLYYPPHMQSTSLPSNPHTRPSTPWQTGQAQPYAGASQSEYRGHAHRASEDYYPQASHSTPAPAPVDYPWDGFRVGGLVGASTLHPAQVGPIEAQVESLLRELSQTFPPEELSGGEEHNAGAGEVSDSGSYADDPFESILGMGGHAVESFGGAQVDSEEDSQESSSHELLECPTEDVSTVSEHAQTPGDSAPSLPDTEEDAVADPEFEQPVSLEEAFEILYAMEKDTYLADSQSPRDSSPSRASTAGSAVGPETPSDAVEELSLVDKDFGGQEFGDDTQENYAQSFSYW
ncbi:hypothetical protein B0H14DRAFT_2574192 [Mycena olivaceomarginata]|nr:hypothetical protein B0H14DRAFT_2574192 [Mycena olivaceomarginata]